MLFLYFTPLAMMLTGVVTSFLWVTVTWIVMGFGMAGIGLSIMHDANHGSYSDNKTVNSIVGFVINFVGGYHVNWKIQHNVLHHSFTNNILQNSYGSLISFIETFEIKIVDDYRIFDHFHNLGRSLSYRR